MHFWKALPRFGSMAPPHQNPTTSPITSRCRVLLRQVSIDDSRCLSNREWKPPLTCWLETALRSGQPVQPCPSKVLVVSEKAERDSHCSSNICSNSPAMLDNTQMEMQHRWLFGIPTKKETFVQVVMPTRRAAPQESVPVAVLLFFSFFSHASRSTPIFNPPFPWPPLDLRCQSMAFTASSPCLSMLPCSHVQRGPCSSPLPQSIAAPSQSIRCRSRCRARARYP